MDKGGKWVSQTKGNIWQLSEDREEFHMSVGGCKRIIRGENKEAGSRS